MPMGVKTRKCNTKLWWRDRSFYKKTELKLFKTYDGCNLIVSKRENKRSLVVTGRGANDSAFKKGGLTYKIFQALRKFVI